MSRSPSDFEKLLWKSAEADAPPGDGAERLAAALTRRLQALSPSSAPPEPPCSGPTVVAAGARSASAWKLIGSVSVVLVPLAATFLLVRSATSGPIDPPPPAVQAVESAASGPIAATVPATHPAEPSPAPVAVLTVDDLPPARTPPATSGRRVPTDPASDARTTRSPEPAALPAADSASRAARSSDLDAEVAVLDEVRAHLRNGAPAKAVALLGHYDVRFPRGLLRPEAEVLQIEARAAAGDEARAHQLAVRFLERHPNDTHAERVRQLEAQLRR